MDHVMVAINSIDANPYQPRTHYDDDALNALAENIARTEGGASGLLQVPIARRAGDRYQLAFGHRRHRAFMVLRRSHFPLIVADLSDSDMLDYAWGENYHRADISAIERAALMLAKADATGTHAAVANDWGLDRSTVTRLINLLQRPDEIKNANINGRLSARQLDAIYSLWIKQPDSKIIKRVLNQPDLYTSHHIRAIAGRTPGKYTIRPAMPNASPAIRLSRYAPEGVMGELITSVCATCIDDANGHQDDMFCKACPLTLLTLAMRRKAV